MAQSCTLSVAVVVASLLYVNCYFVRDDYRESERLPNIESYQQEEEARDFDDGFGTDLDKFVTRNPLKCPHKCQYSLDCCPGNICLKTGKGKNTGYCVKGCKYATPVAPMKDCRLCMTCQRGYVCTLRLSGKYICLPDNRIPRNGQGKSK